MLVVGPGMIGPLVIVIRIVCPVIILIGEVLTVVIGIVGNTVQQQRLGCLLRKCYVKV